MARRPTPRRGTAAVEFAIVLPILTALLFGIWEIGRMVQASQVLINAAREAARQASTGTADLPTIKANVQSYIQGAEPRVTNFTGFDVKFTDVTRSTVTDPTGATQLDRFTITVILPFDNIRWSVIKQFVPAGTNLTAAVDWYSMKDLPVTVTTGMPVE
ncbi:MAG TPA: TadE/TadG family type IV pilus assembly protein [Gemmataceae bacterium]|jgi:Flp pilus assembly protein TadG